MEKLRRAATVARPRVSRNAEYWPVRNARLSGAKAMIPGLAPEPAKGVLTS
jgi:hypothetical protein